MRNKKTIHELLNKSFYFITPKEHDYTCIEREWEELLWVSKLRNPRDSKDKGGILQDSLQRL